MHLNVLTISGPADMFTPVSEASPGDKSPKPTTSHTPTLLFQLFIDTKPTNDKFCKTMTTDAPLYSTYQM
jgi:hypothetical protein